eukprot:scaffold5356_cov335-Prasinococcus_capsulatus_cf.AAC.2
MEWTGLGWVGLDWIGWGLGRPPGAALRSGGSIIIHHHHHVVRVRLCCRRPAPLAATHTPGTGCGSAQQQPLRRGLGGARLAAAAAPQHHGAGRVGFGGMAWLRIG